MRALEHPSYNEEKQKLYETIEWIEGEIAKTEDECKILEKKISETRKEVKSALDERIVLQKQLKMSNERKLRRYKESESKPYFGRVDFKEDGDDKIKKLYIGKYGLSDEKHDEPVVIDWRSPIADIYYSGEAGAVSYKSPSGEISGEIKLKRRYEIEEGELLNIFDEKLKEMILDDEFLTSSLEKSADNRLKDIVATIQKEQNDIIRAPLDRALIIQGVAGSGKTTIALHRLAYLIYQNQRNKGREDYYMVIAPNKLFLNYISDILPDLGADDVLQTTFEDYALKITGIKEKLKVANDKISYLLGDVPINEKRKTIMVSRFKGSLLFKAIIDNYFKQFLYKYIPDCDINIDGNIIFTSIELKKLFIENFVYLPLQKRKEQFISYLKNRLKKNKDLIADGIEKEYSEKIRFVKDNINDSETRQSKVIELYDLRDKEIGDIPVKIDKAICDYSEKWTQLDTVKIYRDIMDFETLKKFSCGKIEDEKISCICDYTKAILDKDKIENEDLAPLLYIHKYLFGLDDAGKFAHIVVDEAQDFSEFKFYLIKRIVKGDSITIVGDVAQGIYSYRGIKSWDDLNNHVLNGKATYKMLKKSYRSTVEIMEYANSVIDKSKNKSIVKAEPIMRHGDVPEIVRIRDYDELIHDILNNLQDDELTTAIICKTEKMSKRIYESLKKDIDDITLINDKTELYKGRKIVIPSYLSKGLEFDRVIIPDADSYNDTELELKLFYVAITRPLHKLKLYYTNLYN
ncbi:AAA family ATPase [Thermoanaerobacterium thermosaccharolyticum]|uniref:RNA polymerase recycling motor HelD n=1 Tax=Thermoanaerobacterium thermosaccharolyticum TaxID=1517 RepID=UPI00279CF2A2|nr:AAA family ATPase [Thermoanaerobacterium thermosaccharolyticum]